MKCKRQACHVSLLSEQRKKERKKGYRKKEKEGEYIFNQITY